MSRRRSDYFAYYLSFAPEGRILQSSAMDRANPSTEFGEQFLERRNRVKDRARIIAIGLAASLSAIMFGYSLKEITSIPSDTIAANYEVRMNANLLQGLLIAIMPFGALFGSLVATAYLGRITRLRGIHAVLPVLCVSILIVQVGNPITLFVGRFMEGFCIGYYVSIAPIYLKEITPKELRAITGTFFALGKIVGVLLVISLELLIGQQGWRIILSVTALLALIQSILLALIGIDTPYEWIARKDYEKARKSIEDIYESEQVQQALQEMIDDYELQKRKSMNNLQEADHQVFENKKKKAFQVAVHVCVIRHFSGGNSLITSAGIIMSHFDKGLAKWTPLSINSTQLIALFVFVVFLSSRFGKRPLLVTSTGLLALLNLLLVYSLIVRAEALILACIIVFMVVYGGFLLSAVWSYPSQIIPASESLIPNSIHWIALSLSTLAPSLVMSLMPNNQVYPCFIFFFAYSAFAWWYFKQEVVESNGKSYQQIIEEFKQ